MLSLALGAFITLCALGQGQGGSMSTSELAPPPGLGAPAESPRPAAPAADTPAPVQVEAEDVKAAPKSGTAAPQNQPKAAPSGAAQTVRKNEPAPAAQPRGETVVMNTDAPPQAASAPARPAGGSARVGAFWILLPKIQ